MQDDASFNFGSYAECFISENLVRKYIDENIIELSAEATNQIEDLKIHESEHKSQGNVSIEIREQSHDLSFLDMTSLCLQVESDNSENNIIRDAKTYRPIRNAVMHTALLTQEGKTRLTTVYDNIRGRIVILLSSGE